MRAKQQLVRSDELRRGMLPTSRYSDGLTGGAKFPQQLRSRRRDICLAADAKYLAFEHEKLQVGDWQGGGMKGGRVLPGGTEGRRDGGTEGRRDGGTEGRRDGGRG